MPTQTELAPRYSPAEVEARLYERWLAAGLFTARTGSPKTPYVIVIPPPNITDILHVGHGLNTSIQDVLIRFERMRGREALWLPGTDHAGIATQNVVEKLLVKEGKSRFDLGREAFVERVWEFVRKTGTTILEQLKTIGCSCDWSRTRFTLDAAYSRAVREVFVRLWEEHLIYRGHRVIHWCPRCLTSLSDEEAVHHETTGTLFHIRYPLADGSGSVTVATTRPETLLGDTAVAVHPDDPRGRPYVGKRARLPIANVEIPILADESVDQGFGTGFVKVTPAHDASDFEIGVRHKLEMPLVMTEDGRMGGSADRVPADLAGLDRFEARKKIVQMLRDQNLLVKTEQHHHSVRRCYRCESVVEPRLSDQWFVKMKPLADPVLAEFRAEQFRIVPERWVATFEHWMENIRDWNISRQLWWGHRIPVFTCTKCRHQWADREDPKVCPKCRGPVEQDPDVLDTWFSSWLWPFATLGWPDEPPDLKHFYPGHTMVTAPEILFFWVARMLMSGYHFMGRRLPFRTVYLHGTVRDMQHRKMSKSLGNGIDPLDVVKLYGADALRWTIIAGSSVGADLMVDPNDLETTFAPGRNFCNKLWNIGRFILSQLPDNGPSIDEIDPALLTLADRWMLSRTQWAIEHATDALEEFRLDDAAQFAFQLAWRDLADWYVEAVKPRLAAKPGAPSAAAQRAPAASGAPGSAAAAQAVLAYSFDTLLRLLHPVVPFITEALWQRLEKRNPSDLLAAATWPERREALYDHVAFGRFGRVQDVITAIREIRADYNVPPSKQVEAVVRTPNQDVASACESERDTIVRLARLSELSINGTPNRGGAHVVLGDAEVIVALEGVIDVKKECGRLKSEADRLDRQLEQVTARLGNESFAARAPADVVAKEREKERTWREQRRLLGEKITQLGCS